MIMMDKLEDLLKRAIEGRPYGTKSSSKLEIKEIDLPKVYKHTGYYALAPDGNIYPVVKKK